MDNDVLTYLRDVTITDPFMAKAVEEYVDYRFEAADDEKWHRSTKAADEKAALDREKAVHRYQQASWWKKPFLTDPEPHAFYRKLSNSVYDKTKDDMDRQEKLKIAEAFHDAIAIRPRVSSVQEALLLQEIKRDLARRTSFDFTRT